MANEPPCAEPHAGWCGESWSETSSYPIIFVYNLSYASGLTSGTLDIAFKKAE